MNLLTSFPFEEEIMGFVKNEQWEKLTGFALCHPESYPLAFMFYDNIPDNLKYDFVVNAYIYKGDHIPACRKAMRSLKKYGSPTLPDEFNGKDAITVYRAGEEEIEKAKYRISWSTDYDIAVKFASGYLCNDASHLYKGKLKVKDIIAYNDSEKETMQYGKVFDVEELPFPKRTELKQYIHEHNNGGKL